jgi:hypothetical protein
VILHPGILALLAGSGIVLLLCLYASISGVRILLRWDRSSSSELQYDLEQRTVLVSTLVRCALAFEVLSGLLFVYTLDDLHPLFVGAMCATGSLNANPVGWNALFAKLAICIVAIPWLVLNHFDEHAEDYPLVRLKYALLPLVTYLVGLDCFYQLSYFLGLHPQVITSCCGALFTVGGAGLAGDLAGLPVVPTMVAFYAGAGLLALLLGACLTWKSGWLRLLLALVAAAFLPLALAAIISFISLYVYQLPTHHCPFDLFQSHYHYLGYPLYLSLFAAVLYGVLPGLFRPLARQASLAPLLRAADRRWLQRGLLALLLFLLLATAPVVLGRLVLVGYGYG